MSKRSKSKLVSDIGNDIAKAIDLDADLLLIVVPNRKVAEANKAEVSTASRQKLIEAAERKAQRILQYD